MTCPVSLPERDMPAVQHVTGRDNVNPGSKCSVGTVDPFNMIVKYRFVRVSSQIAESSVLDTIPLLLLVKLPVQVFEM